MLGMFILQGTGEDKNQGTTEPCDAHSNKDHETRVSKIELISHDDRTHVLPYVRGGIFCEGTVPGICFSCCGIMKVDGC